MHRVGLCNVVHDNAVHSIHQLPLIRNVRRLDVYIVGHVRGNNWKDKDTERLEIGIGAKFQIFSLIED